MLNRPTPDAPAETALTAAEIEVPDRMAAGRTPRDGAPTARGTVAHYLGGCQAGWLPGPCEGPAAGQHGPRDGLRRRPRAVAGQHPVLLPRHARPEASFTPHRRPPFVTELEPSDRCHLNGPGMVDGKPRYVTALGETNDVHGRRPNKARGGGGIA